MSRFAKSPLLLVSLFVAVSVFAGTSDSAMRSVLNARGGVNCKKPCDNGTFDRKECLDPCNLFYEIDPATKKPKPCVAGDIAPNSGGKCNKNFCTVNTYRFYECAEGDPASGNECKSKAADGWYRRAVTYEGACTTAGEDAVSFNCKTAGTKSAMKSPCGTTDACGAGAEKNVYPKPGRQVCN
jgi:hypothetical protein